MQTFDITLKNEKEKTYRFIIFLFVILHILFFIYLAFDHDLWKIGVAGLVITLLYSGYRWLITNTDKQQFSFGSGYFFLFSIIWIWDLWWMSVVDLILYLLSSIALSPVIFSFSPKEITKVFFPRKKINWDQMTNVLLKDNILTMDFKNNRLLQAEISSPDINEEAFNTFAKQQLDK